MSQEVYQQLLEVMKKRGGGLCGNGYPRVLRHGGRTIHPAGGGSQQCHAQGTFYGQNLAGTMGRDEEEIEAILEAMADKGLCMAVSMDQNRVYQTARFMPGILEFQFMPGKTTDRDKKIAQLIYAYKKAYDRKDRPNRQ